MVRHRSTTRQRVKLMTHYADQGRNLRDILKLIGIGERAAKKWARSAGLKFNDYKPRKTKA